MNPASAASAVQIDTGMSGLSIAAFVILALVVVVLALALIHAKWPNSAVGKDVTKAETDWKELYVAADTEMHSLRERLKNAGPVVQTAISGFELYAGNEFEKVILGMEKHASDTSAEDADIAEAAKTTANAIDSKRAKAIRIENHIATMQTLRDKLNASLPLPTSGS